MKGIVRGLGAITPGMKGTVVTLGNFDGVHLGHQKILARVRQEAEALGAGTLAITFDPHPIKVLAPERAPRQLTDIAKKADLIRRYGIDNVLIIEFTREFAAMAPEDFVRRILVERLGARSVVVGSGYSFGKGRRGGTDFLRRQGYKYGFGVHVVRQARMFQKVISSTRIRVVIGNGNVEKATKLLGRPYTFKGTVVSGAGRGDRLLSTPTANIETMAEVIPRDGVYAVRALIGGGGPLDAVANIGNNPTFQNAARSFEVHVLDFREDLRGDEMEVRFIKRLRNEEKFPSVEALRAQIALDIAEARRVLGLNPPSRY